jgi:uncharacterized membrane protein
MSENISGITSSMAAAKSAEKTTEGKEVVINPPAKGPRYGFIDLLRGFALVVMVETHVMNAYLPMAMKKGSEFFFWLAFINGLVAPTFLFATGFSLVLQSNRQWDSWLHLRLPFWIQMRRLGFIFLVAYYTHLQHFSLRRYLADWNNSKMWERTLQVDILQCIVVSLLVVMAIILIFRSKRLFPWIACPLAVSIALATPWIWSFDFRGQLPLAIALFLNPHGVSLFPIFPWMCFVLAGCCACHFFLKSVDTQKIQLYMRITACLGGLMIACGLLLRNAPYSLPGAANFYTTSPLYLMIRLGSVLLICVLLYRLEAKGRWIPKPVQLAGQEPLLVYGVHLWLIYALLRGRFLAPILGKQFGYLGCVIISVAIILFMLFLARHWHTLKRNYPGKVRLAQAIIVAIMIAVFILN